MTSPGELADPSSASRLPTWASTSSLAVLVTSTVCIRKTGRPFLRAPGRDQGSPVTSHWFCTVVLHSVEDQIKKAISLGVSKINVNTDLQVVHAKAIREYVEAGKDQQGKGYDPRKLIKPAREAIVARTKELMEQFGSVNKA